MIISLTNNILIKKGMDFLTGKEAIPMGNGEKAAYTLTVDDIVSYVKKELDKDLIEGKVYLRRNGGWEEYTQV